MWCIFGWANIPFGFFFLKISISGFIFSWFVYVCVCVRYVFRITKKTSVKIPIKCVRKIFKKNLKKRVVYWQPSGNSVNNISYANRFSLIRVLYTLFISGTFTLHHLYIALIIETFTWLCINVFNYKSILRKYWRNRTIFFKTIKNYVIYVSEYLFSIFL